MQRSRTLRGAALAAVLALAVAGCGSAPDSTASTGGSTRQKPPDVKVLGALGTPEGELDVVAWAGYAEDGSNDKTQDWVTPFEKATGCQVNVKIGNTSDEMVALMKTGECDVVSASGDATLRLIYGGDVAPINPDLVPSYGGVRLARDALVGRRRRLGAAPFGLSGPGFGLTATVVTLAYLWLPYMVLPLYAGLERLPDSLLEASADLGASTARTLRTVVLPLLWPSLVAGALFTFSLTLGDYITVKIVGGAQQLFANVVYDNLLTAGNLPFAAAAGTFPVVVMLVYLALARRTGALDQL